MQLRLLAQIAVFTAVFFVAAPAAFISLNEALGWPRVQSPTLDAVGTTLIVCGAVVFLYCSGLLWRIGGGTPAPNIDPPSRLVVAGLYQVSRNPMYVGYVAAAIGIFFLEGHLALALYVVALFLVGEIYVVKWEEPALRRRFGADFERYCQRVPRWIRVRGAASSGPEGDPA